MYALHGHHDWRVPTKSELNMLFNNRAAFGGFNQMGPAGWHWSSTELDHETAWDQRFRDGMQDMNGKVYTSTLPCVRG